MAASRLYGIIQAHTDRWGVRDAEVARRIGIDKQTISRWKNRGIQEVPPRTTLMALADVTGTPYEEVLIAALADANYVPDVTDFRERILAC